MSVELGPRWPPQQVSSQGRCPKMFSSLKCCVAKGTLLWQPGPTVSGSGEGAARLLAPSNPTAGAQHLPAGCWGAPRANPAVSHGEASSEGAARLNQDALRRGAVSVCARLQLPCLLCSLPSFLPSWLPPTFPQLVIAKGSPLPRLSLVRAFAGSKRRLGAEGLGTEGLCERGRGVPCPALETRTGPGGCEAVG